ncbi:helix-turn-helix domain-containing protein, partial [Pseudomonas sp. SIMBA_059]
PADMELLMSEIIQASLQRSGQGRMNKQAKVEAVRVMQERGLFIVKGGVEKAASALGVTRYTIYNYLEQLRGTSQ